MLEALRCVDEGSCPEAIDAALVAFGMPIGPVELVDTVGLDIAMAAGKTLAGDAAGKPPRRLVELHGAGKLGRKSGEGSIAGLTARRKKLQLDQFQRASPNVSSSHCSRRRAAALPKAWLRMPTWPMQA